ncbi:MAG: type II toxin-antitoxin system HicB family antitoxin [Candidatus Kapabacteria bacterium]|nr:type II toxin-antitoxin system HicB family antitoxin [Candidatus Kapabacteria bacterium]
MSKYAIKIYWNDQDSVFIAEVPDLPGCLAHGETDEIALKNIHEAIDLWLETAKEFGDEIPEPSKNYLIAV